MLLESRGVDSSSPVEPNVVLAELQASLPQPEDPASLLAMAELHEMAGRKAGLLSKDQAVEHDYIAAVLASKVLFDLPRADSFSATAEQLGQARVVHDRALARLLKRTGGADLEIGPDWFGELDRLGLPIVVRQDPSLWNPSWFHEIKFCSDYRVRGIRSHIRNPGVGVPMFGVRNYMKNPDDQPIEGEQRFYPKIQVYPTVAVLRPPTEETHGAAVLEFHDPLRFDAVRGGSATLLLASDLSTPVAYHFATGNLAVEEQIGMFRPEHFGTRSGLHLLHPYEPGKMPIVFVHGLWSSPKAFAQSLNELRGDPLIRSKYQFWFFMYPSGDPYLHTAALLRDDLRQVRHVLDPNLQDPALDQMVVVGHSMGGLLVKLTIEDSNDRMWKLFAVRPFDEVNLSQRSRELLRKTFFFEANRSIRRVVFIATPHRGSQLGNNVIGRIGSSLIERPKDLSELHDEVMRQNDPSTFGPLFGKRLVSSIDLLGEGDATLAALDETPIAPWVVAHSIVGNIANGPLQSSTDGVVPYRSSHLESAKSEYVVPASHFLQDDPRTIAELKRILVEHSTAAGPEIELSLRKLNSKADHNSELK
jgi:pimeloyl-ACP methyl ester carboxylesterase